MASEIEVVTVLANSPRVAALVADGWVVMARSWGARLVVDDSTADRMEPFVALAEDRELRIRELDSSWAGHLLELDASTSSDYPDGPATTHVALDPSSSAGLWSDGFRVFGAVTADATRSPTNEQLVGVTVVGLTGTRAETEFTVVSSHHRRRGIARAVKASSIRTLISDGASVFGTGGSADNTAMLAVNTQLGYVVTEEWVSLAAGQTNGS